MFDVYKWITNIEKTILVLTIPIFIAITALCRLIILQGKGISTIDLIYESGAVLLLALSALVIRWNLVKVRRDSAKTQTSP